MATAEGLKTVADGIRPEGELLLCCSRTVVDSRTGDRIQTLVRNDIDWKYLTEFAHHHRVLPLLYRNLNATCPDAVPKPVLDHLRRFFHANALTCSLLSKELVRLLNLFAAHGIVAVPYKGPALAASVYGDMRLRELGDLDVLVRRKDVLKARELMISQRYRSTLTGEQEKSRLQFHYHLDFLRDDGSVFVELHWALTPKYWRVRLDLESFEERLESVSLVGEVIPQIPSPELLLILCAHGAKHYWKRLRWICDIAELIRHETSLDWDKLTAQVKRLRCKRILNLGLFLAKDLFDAQVPKEIWQDVVRDRAIPQLAAQVREKLFPAPGRESEIFDHRRFFLMTREKLGDRMRYFYHDQLRGYLNSLPTLVAPNTSDRARLPLPPALGFLYYLIRPIRLCAVYGLRLAGVLMEYVLGLNISTR